ncbi:MBL fold metallo-hydrolase [Bradyrhizobium sp. WBOS7]|uniref:MBL fold metallo-hydrolase n=1 Tax=Bradyrhizobium betae TaxID=244734 RepID=A0AAE9N650_9BRAD|nr:MULTISPECIES: MBL fold metallo-hydrolase [Bradyrhizobium]MDD1571215.1 MBL fold metallo-hydrolase [Bradyrhizobium sp. WBOS1]UUO34469.1 MBL fold metallo-hydrolase [Bradyrhizobium sp. WBOS01]MDD1531565.1 MBL fold metallo-hydrolase [Bradyrhizobium sp. WBOS2]MDD1581060.1 MBL fold metallo-hydrolase [Bradyrhizobium sp. WBOS7]MDD1601802.1 MBL fold metallo-hydrolase [Bradyrhizobium sp. WBOS16]
MFEVSRRDLVLGSTGAALVFGLQGPVSFIGAASAQRAADSLTYKVGDIEVFSLHEGSIERPVTEGIVKNAGLDDVKKALTAAGLGPDKIDNPFTVTAIRTGGKVVLFDTGFGGNGPASVGKLAGNMKAAGLDPEKVSTVVISHFHPDHISGLWVKETNAQVFPNAEIMMPETEYKFWTDAALVEKVPEANRAHVKRIQATFPTWKNIKQYGDGADLAPGVKAIATPGHTIGHMSFLVASGGQQLFIQSDVTGIHQLFVRNPGWFSGFDSDGPKAEATRRAFFDRVIAEKGMIAGYHFGFPNVGTLTKDGNGYAFAAVKA